MKIKLKNSNCDKTKKTQIVTKLKKLKLCQHKTKIKTKLKNSSCYKTKKFKL